jgi:ribosomal protein S18 acetylase RimI-like enzyme
VPDADDEVASALLAPDRIWAGYLLGDLDPPFRAFSTIALAHSADQAASSAYLVLRHPDFTATVTFGAPHGIAAIMEAVDLPDATFVSTRAEHLPALERRYAFRPGLHEMRRMHVAGTTFARPHTIPAEVVRLAPADLAALLELYEGYAESAFVPDHLTHGVFHGVREDSRLLAAGGTHIVSERFGIAAVGNIFTRPEARGRGYGTVITAAVTEALLGRGCRDVILNVAVSNRGAAAIYERLGFREHCRFWEGTAEHRVK